MDFQVSKVQFRTLVYKRHHLSAHPEKWKEFQATSQEGKVTFFDAVVNHASTVMDHFESEGTLTISFNRDVVKVLVRSMLFNTDDKETQGTRERALAVLKHCHDDAALNVDESPGEQDMNREAYYVTIVSVCKFKIVLGFISMGALFRSASRLVDVAWKVCKASYLYGCSQGVCASYVRIICGPFFRKCMRSFVAAGRIMSRLTLGMLKARHILICGFDSVAGPGSCQIFTS